MKKLSILATALLFVATSVAAQTGNQTGCEVPVVPAATLLLPYFAVEHTQTDRTLAQDTLFSIVNVSDTPIVAHVTIWSNWSFPVLDFNVYLTGYDTASLSLYDIIARGTLPSTGEPTSLSPRGTRSLSTPTFTGCNVNQGGVGVIPPTLQNAIRSGLTGGPYQFADFGCTQVGDVSTFAQGYVTIDTSTVCSLTLPTDPDYYASEISFRNQIVGDYQRVNPSAAVQGLAGGESLVHIRSFGAAEAPAFAGRTFYRRYSTLNNDRRIPLPALFAARYIEGGGAAVFDTNFAIWREGQTDGPTTEACGAAFRANATMPFREIVRFDERENPTISAGGQCTVSPCEGPSIATLPEASLVNINNGTTTPGTTPRTGVIPPDPSADPAGWVYFNLNNPNATAAAPSPTQNWVTVRMTAETRFAVDFDAAYLGNGCTPAVGVTATGVTGPPKIGPQGSRIETR